MLQLATSKPCSMSDVHQFFDRHQEKPVFRTMFLGENFIVNAHLTTTGETLYQIRFTHPDARRRQRQQYRLVH